MASALTQRKNASCLNASARWIRRLLQLSLTSPLTMPSSWLSVYLAAASVTERFEGSSQVVRSRDCMIESALARSDAALTRFLLPSELDSFWTAARARFFACTIFWYSAWVLRTPTLPHRHFFPLSLYSFTPIR